MHPPDRPPLHYHNVPDARRLRQTLTPKEAVLWEQLRKRRLNGHKFRRQHPVKNFVLDFYCPDQRLAIEVDGGVHNDRAQQEHDQSRESILRDHGIRILRIPAHLVTSNMPRVLALITAALANPQAG